jgi:hypothetical protein
MNKRWLMDTAERTVRTFIQAVAASIAVTGWSLDAVKIGAGAGGLAVLTSIGGKQIGSGTTGSILPGAVGGALGAMAGGAVGSAVGETVGGVGTAVGGVVSGVADVLDQDKKG